MLKEIITSKAGFPFYTDYWKSYFCKMTGEQVKECLRIIFHFNETFEILESGDLAIEMVTTTIIGNIKRDAEKRTKQIIANRDNGSKGGRPFKDLKLKKTQPNPNPTPNPLTEDFQKFWEDYTPVKVLNGKVVPKGSRKAAMIAYERARKKHGAEKIYEGAAKYLVNCYENNRLSCQAVVFLNQERFLDDYEQTNLEVKKHD
jgi:ribosomal protein S17